MDYDDIPQICDLFAKIFRPGRKVRREKIEACFAETYLTSPLDKLQPASLVDIGPEGRLRGFMGIITLGARLNDTPLRGGMLGNFMATESDRPKSALRLLRATVAQDLSFVFSDTANRTSLDLSRALKFDALPLHSLEWVKILRPFETASFMLGRHLPKALLPITLAARAADIMGRRLPFAFASNMEFRTNGIVDRSIEPAVFVARAPDLLKRFSLRPDWGTEELGWLLHQSAQNSRYGALHLREVADHNGKTFGFYIMYARAGAVAYVLQILPRRRHEAVVLGAMIRYASTLGAVAIRGTASPVIADGLMRQAGIFYHHTAATVVHTKDARLREAFRSEHAFLGGLLGESWTRLVANAFN